MTDAEIAAWHVRAAAGETPAEIAADTGRAVRTVQLHLERLGVDTTPDNPRLGRHLDAAARRRIVAWRQEGLGIRAIRQAGGHSYATVQRVLQQAGVDRG